MNVVLDTNILISARMFGGKPRRIFELAMYRFAFTAYTSEWLVDEFIGVLRNKFYHDEKTLTRVRQLILKKFVIVNPTTIPTVITNDQTDNQVLAIALLKPIDYIVSGDKHLLQLKKYHQTPVVTPNQFLILYS